MIDYPFHDWADEESRKVFFATLPKLKDPNPEQLEMLEAYAHCLVNMRRYRSDPQKAAVWRLAMLYCRNGLGIGQKVFVDRLEILLNWDFDIKAPEPWMHLKDEWQLPESERPAK